MLNHVYLQNKSLRWKLHLFGTISFSTLILAIIVYYIIMKKQSRNMNIKINLNEQENASAPEENPLEKSSHPDISDERLQQINNYLRMPTAVRPI